jgi:hypothetical protein
LEEDEDELHKNANEDHAPQFFVEPDSPDSGKTNAAISAIPSTDNHKSDEIKSPAEKTDTNIREVPNRCRGSSCRLREKCRVSRVTPPKEEDVFIMDNGGEKALILDDDLVPKICQKYGYYSMCMH